MIFYPSLPPWSLWLNNIPTIFIKTMYFIYPRHGISIQFPLIPIFSIPLIFMISKRVKISTPFTCETELVGTVTFATMRH